MLTGCGSTPAPGDGSGRVALVAAENVWGDLAAQLGGTRVQARSIVTSSGADPHTYEPTPSDARALAGAQMVLVNGLGYDTWAARLLRANPTRGRLELDVGGLLGLRRGANPHRWYSPPDVERVITAITADYKRLDPIHAAYFDARRTALESHGLAAYHRRIATLRARYAGVAIGASESVFTPLAQALGLRMITPPDFLKAVSDGTDPTALDRATVEAQIRTRRIRLWAYNLQNTTPDVRGLTDRARAAGIPVVPITETLAPAGATFQDWQTHQLERLAAGLARGTGR